MFGGNSGQGRMFPLTSTNSVFDEYPRSIPVIGGGACSPAVVPLYLEGYHPVLAARIGAADIGVRIVRSAVVKSSRGASRDSEGFFEQDRVVATKNTTRREFMALCFDSYMVCSPDFFWYRASRILATVRERMP